MIFVDELPFPSASSSEESKPPPPPHRSDTLLQALLDHPSLESASNAFKAIPELKFSAPSRDSSAEDRRRWVYLFQREYATVDPAFVHFVGTDEATTCMGLAIRNPENGMTSVAHLDSPEVVYRGLSQMMSLLVQHNKDVALEVHLVGGFEDVLPNVWPTIIYFVFYFPGIRDRIVEAEMSWTFVQHLTDETSSETQAKLDGYSFPLGAKIVETLLKRPERFHIRTLCVLRHNTRKDPEGNAYPIFHGFMMSTSTGSIVPASFDETSRCPDEIVRRIRVSASYEDSRWKGKLLETYETQTDRFKIAPCCWTSRQSRIALSLQNYSDSEILVLCSTSPSAEAPDFVNNLRRMWDYLIEHPDWRETFPMKQPRLFERTAEGVWKGQ